MSEYMQALLVVFSIAFATVIVAIIVSFLVIRYIKKDDDSESRTCGECWYYNRETHAEYTKYRCHNSSFGARCDNGKIAPQTKACRHFAEKE